MAIKKTQVKILVTGANGYIGSHLIPKLLSRGYKVRAMVRHHQDLDIYAWSGDVEMVQADVLKPETLAKALEGVSFVYYLIHSMAAGENFEQRDIQAATNFANAAKAASVERIIYLGGLGKQDSLLSDHLRSRQEVGGILAGSGIPLTEFRAGVIVGAGSLSFEMIRYLTDRVPLMICPKWVFTKIQPISIKDVLGYLAMCLETKESAGRVIEIGGSDILTYGDLMLIYAQQRGLRRFILRVPVLTPKLSSYWVHLVTPIPSSMAIPLIKGLKNEVIVENNDALQLFPNIIPEDYKTSVRKALEQLHPYRISPIKKIQVQSGSLRFSKFYTQKEGMIIESKSAQIAGTPGDVYQVLERMGGENGWWGLECVWRFRGLIDRWFGGEGYACFRSNDQKVCVGDQIDFLDVENVIEPKELLFKVRFKLPGKGWMQFKLDPKEPQRTTLILTAFFAPKGLGGIFYWYALLPVHRIIFTIMLKKIISKANQNADRDASVEPV
ncbi:MAG: SDR family oxidoreductase [Phycisphaerae bacterium]|nr:SDR family oxidoreductase [Phycisphaerae bacterium]